MVLKLKSKPLNTITKRKDSAKAELMKLKTGPMNFPGHIIKEGRIGKYERKVKKHENLVQNFQCLPRRSTKKEKLRFLKKQNSKKKNKCDFGYS